MSYSSPSSTLVRARVEADHLLKDLHSAEPTRVKRAATRLQQLPYFEKKTPDEIVGLQEKVKLQQALHLIAIESGFGSWDAFRAAAENGGTSIVTVPKSGPLEPEHLLVLAAAGIRDLGYEDLVSRMDGNVLEIREIVSNEADAGDIVHFFAGALRRCGDARVLVATADTGGREDCEALIATQHRIEYCLRYEGVSRSKDGRDQVFRITPESIETREMEDAECVSCGSTPRYRQRPADAECDFCHRNRWTGRLMSEKVAECVRCGSALDGDGRCADGTCPFSDHSQECAAGWNGHPEQDPHPDDDTAPLPCSCGSAAPTPEVLRWFTVSLDYCGVWAAAVSVEAHNHGEAEDLVLGAVEEGRVDWCDVRGGIHSLTLTRGSVMVDWVEEERSGQELD